MRREPPRASARDDLDTLIDQARQGVPRAVARLLSLVENESGQLREIAAALAPFTGRARVIGLTGAPGVGKSTMTSALVSALRDQRLRVGVLAIDPSSPFSGGALLGDRVRMQEHAVDSGVFVRSLASRGHLGGLSAAVPQALRVLDAAGFDVVLIETVGVGQSEVDVVRLADTTVVMLAPGMGDGIQAAKAGILEIADIFVVNKADRPGADAVSRDLRQLQSYGAGRGDRAASDDRSDGPASLERWTVPVVSTCAETGQGIGDVLAALEAHHRCLTRSGLRARRTRGAAAEIEALALAEVHRRFAAVAGSHAVNALAERVSAGALSPHAAADVLVSALDQHADGSTGLTGSSTGTRAGRDGPQAH
ncbi:methylmalonyl Co-A mutase-associated GTPase MeaB [Jatrophihabitans telluris]|uniref:Methylmalonyl Co-A mutase-associated GTPase MeaB n=1 Tax=Jatrophihabitans telluris TaxID=2038343 RepID=A0ABY4R342_9ACTN|nr:methylmalonyl Co-A mutase-associated GTPase MeaB [Jatrophihabitans telluris]UQX89887.1 methylmalonyl Co-A mutase-associated GTPase MeaB [Jatrophihabitans telluris]